jgi:hypothetical protein
MPEKKEPQNFALLLADADGGTVNQYLSRKFAEMMGPLQDRASLHEDTFTGEFTVKIKVSTDHRGKVEWKPACSVKLPAEKMPSARFFTDDNMELTRQDPRAAGDLYEAREKRARMADGPKGPKMAGG